MLVDVPTLAASVTDLLAGAERREPFVNPDGRSESQFERVWIDGEPHVLKYVDLDHDFTMRVSGDIGCRPTAFPPARVRSPRRRFRRLRTGRARPRTRPVGAVAAAGGATTASGPP